MGEFSGQNLYEGWSINEAKIKFKKINWDTFESLTMSTEDYYETEVDGKSIWVHWNGDNIDAVYYTRKKVGSYSSNFKSNDIVEYTELDPYWPWS